MTALRAEGCGIALTGDAYKVSVTGFTFSIIRYDKHYGNQPPPVAFPPFGALRHHLPPAGRLYGFRRQRRYKKWRRRRRTFPVERYFIPPEGGALNPPVRRSRSQAEPWQPRAERPGGAINPHARKGVSTFGNTGKHRPSPGPGPDPPSEPSSPKGACP